MANQNFSVVGGRLRIAHESNDRLEIQTEIVRLDEDFVVVKANVEISKGKFAGTCTVQRSATQGLPIPWLNWLRQEPLPEP